MSRVSIEISRKDAIKTTTRAGSSEQVFEATVRESKGMSFGQPVGMRFSIAPGDRHAIRPASFYPSAYAMIEALVPLGLKYDECIPITYVRVLDDSVPRDKVRFSLDVLY